MVKNYAKFEEVGIRQIKPEGWLGDFFEKAGRRADGTPGSGRVSL